MTRSLTDPTLEESLEMVLVGLLQANEIDAELADGDGFYVAFQGHRFKLETRVLKERPFMWPVPRRVV